MRPRTFSSLRPQPPEETGERTIEEDFRDLFASPMGQRVLMDMLEEAYAPSPEGADDRALREREGARKFVARLRTRATRGRRAGTED